MSLTARTTPSSVTNSTARLRIERTGSATARLGAHAPLRRVERVAQPIAHEVDAEDDEDDHDAREDGEPPRLGIRLRARDEDAERRRRRPDPEAEEGQRRLGDDRRADGKRAVDDDRAERVREHV